MSKWMIPSIGSFQERSEITSEASQRPKPNYKEELVHYFFVETLPYIVDEWNTLDVDDHRRNLMNHKFSRQSDFDEKFETEEDVEPLLDQLLLQALEQEQLLGEAENDVLVEEVDETQPEAEELSDPNALHWFVPDVDEFVNIKYKGGHSYDGPVSRKLFTGVGVFHWSDGTCYQGEFSKGNITGSGKITFPNLSYYIGHVCCAQLHGVGSFYPFESSIMYSGQWKNGKKHGSGWLLYDLGNYYDGEFYEDLKQGKGLRRYGNGTVYNGSWLGGRTHGRGTIKFSNNDFYKGEWENGLPHGRGQYVWNAALTRDLTLAMVNSYEGAWREGKRDGMGIMYFGMEGSKLAAVFKENEKHGAGVMVCGDGTIIEKNPLFVNDVPAERTTKVGSTTSMGRKSIQSTHRIDRYMKQRSRMNFVDTASRMGGMFPTLEPKCNPINIPIHGSVRKLNTTFHVLKLINAYVNDVEVDIEASLDKVDAAEHSVCSLIEETEKRMLQNCINLNYPLLENVYNLYANMNCLNKCVKPVMSRMVLWQFYKDLKIHEFGLSLIQIDLMMGEDGNCALETKHYPFERIFFWQFIFSILHVIYYKYYSVEYVEQHNHSGIYARMLQTFIDEMIIPNTEACNCVDKYEYLVPIVPMYKLYLTIGEPHTARTLLNRICVKYGDLLPCRFDLRDEIPTLSLGRNVTVAGSNYVYLLEQPVQLVGKDTDSIQKPYPLDKDIMYDDLRLFRKLGPKKIMRFITDACPFMLNEGLMINIDYELTFLDFYEVLIRCAEEMIKMKMEQERKNQVEQTDRKTSGRRSGGSGKLKKKKQHT